MKTVRLKNNIVVEIIPEYAQPVSKWYGADFAAQCVEAPDVVDVHWIYNPETDEFSELQEPAPEPDPSDTEPVTWAALDAAYQEGVSTAYDQ